MNMVTEFAIDFTGDPSATVKANGMWDDPEYAFQNFIENSFGAGSSGDEIERLSGLNAQFIEMEATETKRRATLQHEDLVKQVIGIQASSGFLAAKGTSKDYVEKIKSSFQAELEYMDKVTASQIEISLLEGDVQAEIAEDQAQAGQFGVISDIIGIFK